MPALPLLNLSPLRRNATTGAQRHRWLLDTLPLRGWADFTLLVSRPSPTHGIGCFARTDLRPGQLLGEYPGVVGTPAAVWAKCCAERSRGALAYAFQADSSLYVDPTDADGCLGPDELARWGPLVTDAALARLNEPDGAQPANVVALEALEHAGGSSLMFWTTREVKAGEELLLSYGGNYDRSSWNSS
jgi:hypothetical protein